MTHILTFSVLFFLSTVSEFIFNQFAFLWVTSLYFCLVLSAIVCVCNYFHCLTICTFADFSCHTEELFLNSFHSHTPYFIGILPTLLQYLVSISRFIKVSLIFQHIVTHLWKKISTHTFQEISKYSVNIFSFKVFNMVHWFFVLLLYFLMFLYNTYLNSLLHFCHIYWDYIDKYCIHYILQHFT